MATVNGDARHDKKLCDAKKRQGSGTCTRPAGWGTDHPGFGACKLHGGSTRNGGKAASKEIAKQAVAQYGLPIEVEPHQALLEELYRTAGHVEWLGTYVRSLEEAELTGPVGTEGYAINERGDSGPLHHPRQEPSVWIRLYQEERTHLAKVAKSCIDAGIEERRVRIVEQQGQLLAGVITSLLKRLDIDPREERVRSIIRDELSQVVTVEARELEPA